MLACCLLSRGVAAFGFESALPMMQDLHAHLPVAHQTVSSVFSANASPQTNIIELSQSVPSIQSAGNALASSIQLAASSNGDTSVADIASSLLDDYRSALDAEPLKVKIITGCLLAIVGDAIAQSGQPEEYNKKRAAAFVMFDAVWRTVQQVTYGPIIQTCNGKFSTSLLGSLAFAQDAALKEENKFVFGAIEQTLVSQLVLIPLLYYPIFYSVTGVVQNLTVDETITRAKETFIQLMKRNLLFWIPVQFCAFYFVEENLQIPVLTASGLIWTVILSLSAGNVSSSSADEEELAIEEQMVLETGATEGAVGLPSSSFYYGSNVTAYDESTDEESEESSTASEKISENDPVERTRK